MSMFYPLSVTYKPWLHWQAGDRGRKQTNITLPDGKVHVGTSWETTPFEIVRGISKSLAERTVVARVNDELWDLTRPFEADSAFAFLDFTPEEGNKVFWHSSAHMLGEAAEPRFGAHLAVGPPTTNGFYYEMALPENCAVSSAEDVDPLTTLVTSTAGGRRPFQRLTHIIGDRIPDGTSTTVYRCGPLIDLCRGPHIVDTGKVKAFAILKLSASYFLGGPANDPLQRVYGISFPDKKQLTEHLKFLEETAKRDHWRIGKDQELFMFHDLSPGCYFFLPYGSIIYNALQSFIRKEYWKRGYQEVHSPNMSNSTLRKKSGHWERKSCRNAYDMLTFEVEKDVWALKPMNCPGHCLIFGSRARNYTELPIRMAEFGVLHRNEASGALGGLTCVRRFVQDYSHIFCTEDQVGDEVSGVFDFLRSVYGKLDFSFKLKLSTRQDKFLGNVETWDKAEKTSSAALDKFCHNTVPWELNPGDGAFYGPKCATIQDVQLPERFDLSRPRQGHVRPVIIHRAIYGSFERFIGILTEHFGGRWPFWISPRQVVVIPVMTGAYDYVKEVQTLLRTNKSHADVSLSADTLNKKVRSAHAKELEDRTVTIRSRDSAEKTQSAEQVALPLDEAIVKF
ncbi:putative threonyl-tRNA synthetase, cytoplasmic [Xylaria acuta]|nr:putative threonyl-tRNA synthetase, cytoplasmic [Xylaria acuta]